MNKESFYSIFHNAIEITWIMHSVSYDFLVAAADSRLAICRYVSLKSTKRWPTTCMVWLRSGYSKDILQDYYDKNNLLINKEIDKNST